MADKKIPGKDGERKKKKTDSSFHRADDSIGQNGHCKKWGKKPLATTPASNFKLC